MPFAELLFEGALNGSSVGATLEDVYVCYLIYSVSLFGKIDEKALGIDCECCKAIGSKCLPELLAELSENNSICTMARHIAQKIDCRSPNYLFGTLLAGLVRGSRKDVGTLFGQVLAILKGDESRSRDYGLAFSWLPIEEQYEMLNTGQMPLSVIANIYPIEGSDRLLREIFFMAKYSCSPNQEICHYIAKKHPRFDELMPIWPPSMDISCRKSCLNALRNRKAVHNLFLRDLETVGLQRILETAPWKYWLSDKISVLDLLGCCMADDIPCGKRALYLSVRTVQEYLEAVMDGRIPLLEMKDCATPYDSFLKLVELFCECVDLRALVFAKPKFLDKKQYQLAITHFACKKRWLLRLPEPWVIRKMPMVFNLVEENITRMDWILSYSFKRKIECCFTLITHGQRGDMPDELINSVLSSTAHFMECLKSKCILHGKYYNFVVDSGLLRELILYNCGSTQLCLLFISLVLHFKDDPIKMDKIKALRLRALDDDDLDDLYWEESRTKFGREVHKILASPNEYSSEEIEWVVKAMRECELLDEQQ